MESQLNQAEIFGAIMRPPMWMGINVDFIPVIFFAASFLFILNPIVGFVSVLPLWGIGWLLAKFDPDAIKILLIHHEIMDDAKMLKHLSLLTYFPW